jgi:hypothetical protein
MAESLAAFPGATRLRHSLYCLPRGRCPTPFPARRPLERFCPHKRQRLVSIDRERLSPSLEWEPCGCGHPCRSDPRLPSDPDASGSHPTPSRPTRICESHNRVGANDTLFVHTSPSAVHTRPCRSPSHLLCQDAGSRADRFSADDRSHRCSRSGCPHQSPDFQRAAG